MLRPIKRRPRGVIVCAVLLILGSLYKLFGFLDYDYYVFMFQQLPSGRIHDRYIMSVVLRLTGLVVALGLMYHKQWARRLFLFLCIVTIVTIRWKHPPIVFENIAMYWEQRKGFNSFPYGTIVDKFAYPLYPENLSNYKLVNPSHPIISRITFCTIDIIFCVSMIWYFTREQVKRVFQKSKG